MTVNNPVILIRDSISGEPIGVEVLYYQPGTRQFNTVSVELGQLNPMQSAN